MTRRPPIPHDPLRAARAECRRQVRLALRAGRTVPYSLATLLDAGISAAVIRRVYRGEER